MADPTIVPPAPATATLPGGVKIQTPEVGSDHAAVVALEDKAHALVAATETKAVDLADTTAVKAATLAAEAATKAAELVDAATTRALSLAGTTQTKATQLAVDLALRNQHVDHILDWHGKRLDSIETTGAAVAVHLDGQDTMLARIEFKVDAGIDHAKTAAAKRISTRAFIVTTVGVLAGMAGTTIAALGATGHL